MEDCSAGLKGFAEFGRKSRDNINDQVQRKEATGVDWQQKSVQRWRLQELWPLRSYGPEAVTSLKWACPLSDHGPEVAMTLK